MKTLSNYEPRTEKEFNETLFEEAHELDIYTAREARGAWSFITGTIQLIVHQG